MKSFAKTFEFKTMYGTPRNGKAYILEKTYSSPSNLCLEVYDYDTNEPLCVATTNIAGYRCEPGNVLIKNWSENQGVYEALLKAGVIGPVLREVPTGFVTAYECEYLWGK